MPTHNRWFNDQHGNPSAAALANVGPVLTVHIQLPEALANHLEQQGASIPSPYSGVCLIDTGATNTAVSQDAINHLGMTPHDTVPIGTGAGQTNVPVCHVKLEFPQEGIALDGARALGVDLSGQTAGGQQIVALLGRDVLAKCVLIYNGTGGFFSLSL